MKQLALIFILIIHFVSSARASGISKFIVENDLIHLYKIGDQISNHYSKTYVLNANSTEIFEHFRKSLDEMIYNGSIRNSRGHFYDYPSIVHEVNNYQRLMIDQNFRHNNKDLNDFLKATLGLLMVLENSAFYQIEHVTPIERLISIFYRRNYFALTSYNGSSDITKFMVSFLVARHFNFPMDIVESGLNDLSNLQLKLQNSKKIISSLSYILSGYAALGLKIRNDNLLIWNYSLDIKQSLPLRLINTTLHNIQSHDKIERLELWALQQKYLLLREFGESDAFSDVEEKLTDIYASKNLKLSERLTLWLYRNITTEMASILMVLSIFTIFLKPVVTSIKRPRFCVKIFLADIHAIFLGKENRFWQQMAVYILVFSISLLFDDMRSFHPPLGTFKLDFGP